MTTETAGLRELQSFTHALRQKYGACMNEDHRHWTYFLVDGTNVDEPVAMFCWGETAPGETCERATHLNLLTGEYCHNSPDAPPCDFAGQPISPCEPATS